VQVDDRTSLYLNGAARYAIRFMEEVAPPDSVVAELEELKAKAESDEKRSDFERSSQNSDQTEGEEEWASQGSSLSNKSKS